MQNGQNRGEKQIPPPKKGKKYPAPEKSGREEKVSFRRV
jgi:hypothetical protein